MHPKIHWPVSYRKPANEAERFPVNEETFGMDLIDVPLLETWKAMEVLVKKGKCRTIGVSNFSKTRLEEIWDAAEIKPAVNQVELHPYFAQNDFVKYCQDKVRGYLLSHLVLKCNTLTIWRSQGMVVQAYSPLGNNIYGLPM